MAGDGKLTPEQCAQFDERGFLRIAGLISGERVLSARAYVQGRLALKGLWRDGAWRLADHPRPQWPDTGLKASKAIGNRHADVEALIEDPALIAAVEALLGGRAPELDIYRRPQVLFTLPNADEWPAPTGWHVDVPRLASNRRPGVQVFICLDEVDPRGGGTLAVAGSHRLFNEGRTIAAKDLRRRLCQHEFFRELYAGGAARADDHQRLVGRIDAWGDVSLEVVEMTGAPGDAYLTDLRVLHAGAANAIDRPRMMATHRFLDVGVGAEMAATFGWE